MLFLHQQCKVLSVSQKMLLCLCTVLSVYAHWMLFLHSRCMHNWMWFLHSPEQWKVLSVSLSQKGFFVFVNICHFRCLLFVVVYPLQIVQTSHHEFGHERQSFREFIRCLPPSFPYLKVLDAHIVPPSHVFFQKFG